MIRRILEATREVVRAAWVLCDNTEEDGRPGGEQVHRVQPGDLQKLSESLDALEEFLPAADKAGAAVTDVLDKLDAIERAYGLLWGVTTPNRDVIRARRLLLGLLEKDGQRRGIHWALENRGRA